MTDHDALLAACCAAPDEDTPRLIYADFLEENDEPERAAFVRAQVEYARTLPWEPFAVRCRWRRPDWVTGRPFRATLPPVDGFHIEWHPAAFRRGLGWRVNLRMPAAWEKLPANFLDRAAVGELHLWNATLDDWKVFAGSAVVPRLRKIHFVNSPIEPLRVLRDRPAALGITDIHFERASGAGMPEVVEDLLASPLGRAVRGLHFHVGYESLEDLIDALHTAINLNRLSFSVMGLTAELIRRLLAGEAARKLTELDFRANPLGSDGMDALAAGLPDGLRNLSLSATGAGSRGLEALATSPRAVGLRRLDLGHNPLTPRAMRVMARSGALAGLRSLGLSKCRIGGREMHHLVRAKFWPNLTELDLRYNPIPADGVRHLLDAPVPADLMALVLESQQIGTTAQAELRRKYGDRVIFTASEG